MVVRLVWLRGPFVHAQCTHTVVVHIDRSAAGSRVNSLRFSPRRSSLASPAQPRSLTLSLVWLCTRAVPVWLKDASISPRRAYTVCARRHRPHLFTRDEGRRCVVSLRQRGLLALLRDVLSCRPSLSSWDSWECRRGHSSRPSLEPACRASLDGAWEGHVRQVTPITHWMCYSRR